MIQFFETRMGHRFYESSVPRLCYAIEQLVEQQKKTNELLKLLLEKKSKIGRASCRERV